MKQLLFDFPVEDPGVVNGVDVNEFLADLCDAVMDLEGHAESSTITQSEILFALGALQLDRATSEAYHRKGQWAKDRFGFPALLRADGREYLHFTHQYNVHKEPCGVIAVAYPLDAETARANRFRPCRIKDFPQQAAAD
jgi:hypothetical protein